MANDKGEESPMKRKLKIHDQAVVRPLRKGMGLLTILSLLAVALIRGVPADAGDTSVWTGDATQPVPAGARLTLELDQSSRS